MSVGEINVKIRHLRLRLLYKLNLTNLIKSFLFGLNNVPEQCKSSVKFLHFSQLCFVLNNINC